MLQLLLATSSAPLPATEGSHRGEASKSHQVILSEHRGTQQGGQLVLAVSTELDLAQCLSQLSHSKKRHWLMKQLPLCPHHSNITTCPTIRVAQARMNLFQEMKGKRRFPAPFRLAEPGTFSIWEMEWIHFGILRITGWPLVGNEGFNLYMVMMGIHSLIPY